nr:cation:proton antiporter [Candidatus Njordarchaeum guaymaensis]
MVEAITVFSIAGTIIAIGFLTNALFRKTGLPDTLFLIVIGIVLGPILGVFSLEEMLHVTPFLTTLTLMVILFDGGLNMETYRVISGSLRAAILAVLYVSTATVFISIFGYFVLNLGWLEALMLGPITAGTSSVVIIPLVSKLDIDKEVGVTLSLESTITDVLNIVVVLAILQMYLSGIVDLQQTASAIAARFAVGIILGLVVGILWVKVLGITERQEYTYMLTIAALVLCYVGSEFLGGSGSLSALLFGLALGNYETMYRILGGKTDLSYMVEMMKTLKHFQGEISFLIRAFFFVFLGLVYLPDLLGVLYAVIIVSVNLVLRYTAVTISTFRSNMHEHRNFMTLMCGTGLANAALSVMVYNTLMMQTTPVPQAYLYPLVVANIIIINNIVTSIAPVLMKMKQK